MMNWLAACQVRYLSTVMLLAAVMRVDAAELPDITFSETFGDYQRAVVVVDDPETLPSWLKSVDEETQGQVTRSIAAADFDGKFAEHLSLYAVGDYERLDLIGARVDAEESAFFKKLGGAVYQAIGTTDEQSSNEQSRVQIITEALSDATATQLAEVAFGYAIRAYQFNRYQAELTGDRPTAVSFDGVSDEVSSRFAEDLSYLAKGTYLARDIANTPGNDLYPKAVADMIKAEFRDLDNATVRVLDKGDLQDNNMGALLGVGKGSVHEPNLIVIEYMNGDSDQAPVVLAGKGITFDTGGISIKPNKHMWMMKGDTSGAAAVAGTLLAVASREAKVNVVGLMAMAENMPAEDATRPGDVLKTMRGITVEILSTDAEGRLVLADALHYGQVTYEPSLLVDIATLTGSAMRALGDDYAAIFVRDWSETQRYIDIGERAGEPVWPLPLHPNHYEGLKSEVADIANLGKGNPGASYGAAFLGSFVDEGQPWLHIDMAGVMHTKANSELSPVGMTGWGVAYLDELIRDTMVAD